MERKRIDEKSDTHKNNKRKPSGAAVMRTDLTEALFVSLFEEWALNGYTGTSLEKVAKRIGAGKAAIYRRWPSKFAFASEAIKTATVALTDVKDHGSLEADVHAYLLMFRRSLRHRLVRRILPDLYAERLRSGELAPLIEGLSDFRRQLGHQLLDRAITRGEITESIDREMVLDMLPAALYWRMIISGKNMTRKDIDRQTIALMASIKALSQL
ncbi:MULTISPECIES: TetR/AcrR family transcriptional regulator [unclassified Agarivorans]|uniref:TetR/AcrR family transcriptional regulator n=1 Tax=unclassified Agarivorans TaxID=2636026 RepID=UPI003D7F0766